MVDLSDVELGRIFRWEQFWLSRNVSIWYHAIRSVSLHNTCYPNNAVSYTLSKAVATRWEHDEVMDSIVGGTSLFDCWSRFDRNVVILAAWGKDILVGSDALFVWCSKFIRIYHQRSMTSSQLFSCLVFSSRAKDDDVNIETYIRSCRHLFANLQLRSQQSLSHW